MKRILEKVNYKLIQGNINDNISEIVIDSRYAHKNSLFVCITGYNVDAHNYVMDAYNNGCRNFIVEKNVDLQKDANILMVSDTRKALSLIAQNFYGHPDKKLVTIALTGTKGKTTTAAMIKKIIETNGEKCALIGTLGVFIGDKYIQTNNTTPESLDINRYFRQMVDEGCKYIVMEVSSQALKLGRCEGLTFDYGIFTNMSQDHIGQNEHKDYEEYRLCKSKLFQMCKIGILNKDANEFDFIVKNATCSIKTFGSNNADYNLNHYDFLNIDGKIGMNFNVNNSQYKIYTPGIFSVYNALSAISLAKELGIKEEVIKEALRNFKVKGRVEPIHISNDFSLLIDYAHEAMSLESLLTTMKEYNPKRIVTLFGCGGNRSKQRRFLMGEISAKYSDLTIITEDNSRFENVLDIIEDIKIGVNKAHGNYVAIPNRRDAIKYAIENAEKGDIILLCGKGHEDYQEINGQKLHMDERELIEEIMIELDCKKLVK